MLSANTFTFMAHPTAVQIQKFLGGLEYPADKEKVVAHARSRGADETVLEALGEIPDKKYATPADISAELGSEGDEDEA